MSATVGDLIKFLQIYPADMPIATEMFSEYKTLELSDIRVLDACEARPDGWIQRGRPDQDVVQYLLFPGN